MAQQPINGSKVPVPELGADLSLVAGYLKTSAGTVRTSGSAVKTAWSGLSGVYHAPEDADLLSVMDPVATTTDSFATDVEAVAKALETFAAEAAPLVNTLKNAQGQANAFDAKVKGDGKWDHDSGKVKENNDLLHTVNTAVVAYQAAERKAANAIERLIGGHTWHVADPNSAKQDQYAYGYSSIPDNAKMPWGGKVQKKDGCFKSTLTGVGHFFEGAGASLWGMVTGLGDLVGFGGWQKFKQSWEGLNTIVQLIDFPAGLVQYGPKGYLDRLTSVGKGLIDFDEWKTDPAKAAGNVVATMLTLAVPVGGEVAAGLDGAKVAEVAGDAGKAADAAGDAGKFSKAGSLTKTAVTTFAKYTDPFHYVGQLPKVFNVAKDLSIKIPDMLNLDSKGASVFDHELSQLDHTPAHTPEPAMAGSHTGTGTVDHAGTGTIEHSGPGTHDHGTGGSGSLDHGASHDGGHAGGSGSAPVDGSDHGSSSGGGDSGARHPGSDGGSEHTGDHDSTPSGQTPGDHSHQVHLADGSTHDIAASIDQLKKLRGSSATLTKAITGHGLTRVEFQQLIHTPVTDLTSAQAHTLFEIRHAIPTPKTGTWMQKIIDSSAAQKYLSGQQGADIHGFVSKAADARHLDTTGKLHEGLRLDYDGTKFKPDETMYAIRYQAWRDNSTVIPDGPLGDRVGEHGGVNTGMPDPYTGNGFTKSGNELVPEYLADGSMRSGSELWQISPDGSEHLMGVLVHDIDDPETLVWTGVES